MKSQHKGIKALRVEIKRSYARLMTWRAVGRVYNLPPMTLWRIVHDPSYYPKNARILKLLGLPVLKPAPACQVCGIVHVSTRCPRKRKYKDLFDIPVNELRRMLENRVEYDQQSESNKPERTDLL